MILTEISHERLEKIYKEHAIDANKGKKTSHCKTFFYYLQKQSVAHCA